MHAVQKIAVRVEATNVACDPAAGGISAEKKNDSARWKDFAPGTLWLIDAAAEMHAPH